MLSAEIKNLKAGHKNIRITVGGYSIFIGYRISGSEAIKILGAERLAWLDTHKTIHEYHSKNEIEYVFKANKNFEKLCM